MRHGFAEFVVDTSAYLLLRAGQRVAVQPKVFDLLCYLIEQRARVVSKRELIDALWHQQYVDEFAVPWTVSHLRRALTQARGAQAPIQTVHGRGYRFVAELVELPEEAQAAAREEAARDDASLSPLGPFVGRGSLMRELDERLARAARGNGGFCLLVGDPGMGKTRCIDELSLRARARGFSLWSGRSIEATWGPVFGPWLQILRVLAEERTEQAEAARALEARLTRPASGSGTRWEAGQEQADRYFQYEALAALLRAAAREKPLLLVFDDLHWADVGSWELLSYLAPELRALPILLVGARREGRKAGGRDRNLPQPRDAERFKLAALTLEEVADYLRGETGSPVEPALCALVHSISAGNPWFMRETVDGLIVDHGRAALALLTPAAVQVEGAASDRLRARCAALEPGARAALEHASVLGDRFDVELVARMESAERTQLVGALSVACDEGFITFEPPGAARFAHGLLRQVLYEGLEVSQRLALHLRAAGVLEELADPLRLGEVAHHYHSALPLASPRTAREAAVSAARAAGRAQAFGDAAAFLEWGCEAQANEAQASPRERAELFLLRATMERMAGRDAPARASVQSLVELARERGDADLLLQAARVLRVSFALAPVPDPLALSLLERALDAAPAGASEERVSALSLLSWSPPHALDMGQSRALSSEALALARELGSSQPLQEALHARLYALSGPDDIDALLAVASEITALKGERPLWGEANAHMASYRAHLYRCDITRADESLRALGREAAQRGLSEALFHHDFFVAQRSFSRGEFAESEQRFDELATRGARLNLWQAPLLASVAKTLLTNEREGMAAVGKTPGLDAMLAGLSQQPACYAASGARLAAEAGRSELARATLHALARDDFRAVVKDLGYVNTLTNLALVAIVLDEREHARAIYERLSPYPAHNTPSGAIGFYEGAAARFLGALAAFLGEPGAAERHYEDALALNERLDALPLVARTSYEYAQFLLRHGRRERAEVQRQRALSLAERLGMRALAQSARAL